MQLTSPIRITRVFVVFAVVHSGLASRQAKHWFRAQAGATTRAVAASITIRRTFTSAGYMHDRLDDSRRVKFGVCRELSSRDDIVS